MVHEFLILSKTLYLNFKWLLYGGINLAFNIFSSYIEILLTYNIVCLRCTRWLTRYIHTHIILLYDGKITVS